MMPAPGTSTTVMPVGNLAAPAVGSAIHKDDKIEETMETRQELARDASTMAEEGSFTDKEGRGVLEDGQDHAHEPKVSENAEGKVLRKAGIIPHF